VITAVSFNGPGAVDVISYGWSDDPGTIYETLVSSATAATVVEEAGKLAEQGYIITALGAGNDDPTGIPVDGWVLVGTKVQGDTLPRQLKTGTNQNQNTELWDPGYAIVGQVEDAAHDFAVTWIGER
jgi:hypothetical protein